MATDEVVHNGFVYSRYCPFGQWLCSINDEATDPFHAVWDRESSVDMEPMLRGS